VDLVRVEALVNSLVKVLVKVKKLHQVVVVLRVDGTNIYAETLVKEVTYAYIC
jgi:hypothetical protein